MKGNKKESNPLPWGSRARPLMLAPMQGLTNRALRDLFISWVRPDVVFTEFVRVVAGARQVISKSDRKEITGMVDGVPLVVQLIGHDTDALVSAAQVVQDLGVEHLNINLGCPYGRMNSGTAGGSLLGDPCALADMVASLRPVIRGSFSLKVRSGLDNPREIFSLS
ncbi:MAG: tRNA-dihydrouridine synthase family protein, partial [Desulfobulbaceae bacterium]|nr:tRNA-dihydrouridine synthase family protein [Desulfobulbaceae bacterium]